MKKICLAVVFLFSFAAYGFSQDIQAASKISSIVAYPDSALISRSSSLKLEKGQFSVYFSEIIPDVDESSIRVSGKGTAEVKIFSAQLKKEFLEKPKSERIAKLQDEIEVLSYEIQRIDDEKEVLSAEREFVKSIKAFSGEQISKDIITKVPQAQDLENIVKFLSDKLNANYKKQLELEKEKRKAQKKIDALKNELRQIESQRSTNLVKRSIVVELEAEKAGALDLEVSYLVRGVSWQMIYDARVAFGSKEVELVSYGIVKQNTGEDWSDVEVSLSTAKPSIGGRMPYIAPWFLRPYEYLEKREKKISADRFKESFSQYAAMAPLEDAEEVVETAQVSFAQTEQKGTAIVYNIPRKSSIKADGSEHKLPISSQILKADFEYSACPRISSYAYFGCRVHNSQDLQLLAGKVNVFLEDDFVGASSVDNVGQGEEFDLYLGVDEGVKIERKELEKKVDETLFASVSSSNKKTSFKYRLKVENYKSDKIKVNLFESIPVSQDDRIAVKVGKLSLKPTVENWQDRKGVYKWQLELAPKEKQEIFIDYIIEHPRNMQVEGL